LSRLCTSLLVKYTAAVLKFLSAPTSAGLRHTKLPIHNNIRDFFASPLFTARNSTVNNMCAASLDLERWRASEVVLLDIGKSPASAPARVLCTTTTLLRRERLQPASTNRCNARNAPVAGLASNRQETARSGSRCVATHSQALLAPDSAHATAILAIHMSQSHTFRRLQP
jgi:hypothetical protein